MCVREREGRRGEEKESTHAYVCMELLKENTGRSSVERLVSGIGTDTCSEVAIQHCKYIGKSFQLVKPQFLHE